MPAICAILIVLLILASRAAASPLFDSDAVLDIALSGPLDATLDDKERQERSFTLTHGGVTHDVDVRVRGKSRARVCRFPPLRINFTPRDTAGTVFEGQDKLKLVTHCKDKNRYEQNVLEEYAAYRILGLVAEAAYDTRLLRISYRDTERAGNAKATERYAFFIESRKEFGERLEARDAELTLVSRGTLNKRQEAIAYVFQYLIGNTDWSLVTAFEEQYCCHNGDMVRIGTDVYLVPYDFDLSGLVNARYARPDASLRIKRVTQRLYRGHCTDRETMREALRALTARRDDIGGVVRNLPVVVEKDALKSQRYIERFFELAGDEEKLLDRFERRCR